LIIQSTQFHHPRH